MEKAAMLQNGQDCRGIKEQVPHPAGDENSHAGDKNTFSAMNELASSPRTPQQSCVTNERMLVSAGFPPRPGTFLRQNDAVFSHPDVSLVSNEHTTAGSVYVGKSVTSCDTGPVDRCEKTSSFNLTKIPIHLQDQSLWAKFPSVLQNHIPNAAKFSPLVPLGWAEPWMLWNKLKTQEAKYHHSMVMFEQHQDLDPRKRAVLFSWLSEVCEAFKLQRETYYLALEFIDRFFLHSVDVLTSQLQLTGVTALMLASKMEEISPPKGQDFAYVTDGACNWNQIHVFEPFMSQTLSWSLAPPTLNTWLQLYLQIAAAQNREKQQLNDSRHLQTHHEWLDTSSSADVSALVEHTRTIDLAKVENVQDNESCSSDSETDTCTWNECRFVEVSYGHNDFEKCEKADEKENSENLVEGEHEQDSEKDDSCVVETGASTFEEEANKENIYEENRGANMSKDTRGNKNQQKQTKQNICENFKNKEADNFEERKDRLSEEQRIFEEQRKHCDCGEEGKEDVDCEGETEKMDSELEDEMEFTSYEEEIEECANILYPLYSSQDYLKASQLMDLAIMDSNSLRFKYSVLAAAVVFHSLPCDNICHLTGLNWEEVEPCIQWMKIHKMMLDTSPLRETWSTSLQLTNEESTHTVQDHCIPDLMWQTAMNLSDLYFTSELDQAAVMDHVRQEYTTAGVSCVSSSHPTFPCHYPNFVTPPHKKEKILHDRCSR